MNRGRDWGTRISLLLVVGASLGIAWRLSPRTAVPADEAAAPVDRREPDIHRSATGPAYSPRAAAPSSLEALAAGAGRPGDGGVEPRAALYGAAAPSRSQALPAALDQISDLSAGREPGSLWAVNDKDEKGTIYRIGIEHGAIAQTIDFAPPGDYEGIAAVGDEVIVARNDGRLFRVDARKGTATTLETHLGPECNLEGLAWEPARKRLLMACKSAMPKLPHARKSIGIYALDLATGKVQEQPVIMVPRQAIDDYVGTHLDQPRLRPSMGDEFAPKALAVHPASGRIFLLSARGTMLVVLEPGGALRQVVGLDPLANPQPEGLAFGPDGTMYVSNKSRGQRAHVVVYAALKGDSEPATR